MNKPMHTEFEFIVKAYEIDVVGIVSNIVYIKWFEDLRHAFLQKYYPFYEMVGDGVSPVLMKTEAEYKAPLRIDDHPVGRCWVSKMKGARWEIDIEICTGDKVNCIGKQKGCFYNIEDGMPARVPKRLMDAYEKEINM